MRWYYKRIVRKFAWLPTRVRDEVIWLQPYYYDKDSIAIWPHERRGLITK